MNIYKLIILTYSYTPTYLTPSLSSMQTTSRDAELRQLSETQHLHNANSKLAFRKATFFPHTIEHTYTKLITYADDIKINATHISTHTLKAYVQTYLPRQTSS